MNENNLEVKSGIDQESKERREFLKRVSSTAVALPAAALLIAASQNKATANGVLSGQGCDLKK